MSRTISSGIMEQFEAGELFPVFLFSFSDGGTTYRYTTLDVPFYTSTATCSGTYSPRGLKFDSVTYSIGNIVDQAILRLDNVDQVMTSIFVDGTSQGEDADIYVAVLTNSGTEIGIVNFFSGQVDAWELDEDEVRITISTEFAKWSQKSAAFHSPSCRWKVFKGTECQYAGAETWCDRTYARCEALVNTDNFGGFRWLPDLENREIRWGVD